MQGVFDTEAAPSTKSIEKSISLLGGNPGISWNTSSNSYRTEKYSRLGPFVLSGSST
jgi:hypothetical protein